MKIKYNLLHEEKNTNARLGTIETNYGVVNTPMFMPVGTRATVKTLTPEEIEDCFDPMYHVRNVDTIFKRVGIL